MYIYNVIISTFSDFQGVVVVVIVW